jgi:hypothetical protein
MSRNFHYFYSFLTCSVHSLILPRDSLYKGFGLVIGFKMDLREIGWDGMDWIDLAEDRDQWKALVNTVMNLRVP